MSTWRLLRPPLSSAFQSNAGTVSQLLTTGTPIQQRVTLRLYSDAVQLDLRTFGDTRRFFLVTAWSVSSVSPGLRRRRGLDDTRLVTPLQSGTANTGCTVTGSIPCSPFTLWTVIYPPLSTMRFSGMTLSGVSPR